MFAPLHYSNDLCERLKLLSLHFSPTNEMEQSGNFIIQIIHELIWISELNEHISNFFYFLEKFSLSNSDDEFQRAQRKFLTFNFAQNYWLFFLFFTVEEYKRYSGNIENGVNVCFAHYAKITHKGFSRNIYTLEKVEKSDLESSHFMEVITDLTQRLIFKSRLQGYQIGVKSEGLMVKYAEMYCRKEKENDNKINLLAGKRNNTHFLSFVHLNNMGND